MARIGSSVSRIILSFTLIASSLFIISSRQAANAASIESTNSEFKSFGTGGNEYRLNCPTDNLLSGVTSQAITWRGLNIVSHLQGLCREIDASGENLSSGISKLNYVGPTSGGDTQEDSCEKTSAVTGIYVYSILEESFVSGFKLQCGDLPGGGKLRMSKLIGFQSDKGQMLSCPQNTFVAGLWVRYGEIIDSLGIRCAKITDIKKPGTVDVSLNSTSKTYPYEQELAIISNSGDESSSKYSITKVSDGEGAEGCALNGNILTARSPGICTIEITKAAAGSFTAASTSVNFTFLRAEQSLSIDDLGATDRATTLQQTLSVKTSAQSGTGPISVFVKDGTAQGCLLSDTSTTATLTSTSPGTCLIHAEIAEDSYFTSAFSPDVEFLFADNETDLLLSDLPPYDPQSEPKKTVDLQVAAFAVLTVVSAGAGLTAHSNFQRHSTEARRREDDDSSSSSDRNDSRDDDNRQSGDIASASAKKLSFSKRSTAIGDVYGLWRLSHSVRLESKLRNWVEKTSAYSPVLSRIFHDGSYLRAMFSTLALIPSIAGAILSTFILRETHFVPIPPSFALFITAIALATFDALAGLIISALLFIGTLVTGNIHSLDHFMTSLGISAIIMTPALMASAIRPLHRHVSSIESFWERITDYFLAILLGGWAMEKIVSALNGLAGLQIPITAESKKIGLLVSLFILIRMLLEEIATYFFPERLAEQDAEPHETKTLHPWYSLLFKTALFFAVSYQFLNLNMQLLIGTGLFMLPQIVANIFEHLRVPKTGIIGLLLPKGAPKMIVMIFIGGFFANWVQTLYSTPKEFITWSFVVLTIPGLVIALLGNFATSPKRDWKKSQFGKYVYRFGGIIVALLIIAIYRGADLYHLVFPS